MLFSQKLTEEDGLTVRRLCMNDNLGKILSSLLYMKDRVHELSGPEPTCPAQPTSGTFCDADVPPLPGQVPHFIPREVAYVSPQICNGTNIESSEHVLNNSRIWKVLPFTLTLLCSLILFRTKFQLHRLPAV